MSETIDEVVDEVANVERRCYKCGAFHEEWVCPWPVYPKLGANVEKHRRRATIAGGVAQMDPLFRKEYGRAVSTAIRALQRSELQASIARNLYPLQPAHRPPSIARLSKFDNPPRGLAGNPEFKGWIERDEVLYALAMKAKRATRKKSLTK